MVKAGKLSLTFKIAAMTSHVIFFDVTMFVFKSFQVHIMSSCKDTIGFYQHYGNITRLDFDQYLGDCWPKFSVSVLCECLLKLLRAKC